MRRWAKKLGINGLYRVRARMTSGRPERRPFSRLQTRSMCSAQLSEQTGSMRLSKRISHSGTWSRRRAMELILNGEVRVDGQVVTDNVVVEPKAHIECQSVPLPPLERARMFLLNKLRGELVTNADNYGRPTIFDRIPAEWPRVMSVGRLDFDSEGLLLLSTCGNLSRYLELPSSKISRVYYVHARPKFTDSPSLKEAHRLLQQGVEVDGIQYQPMKADYVDARGSLDFMSVDSAWSRLTIEEGKTREVRRAMGAVGWHVIRLVRHSFGPFSLEDLESEPMCEVPVSDELISASRGMEVPDRSEPTRVAKPG